MSGVVVAAAGALTALGDLDATWTGLLEGRSALVPIGGDATLGAWPIGQIAALGPEIGTHARLDALTARLLAGLPALPAETPLVVATTKAAADELLASPDGPWQGQPWGLAGALQEQLGLTGPIHTISAACASGTLAIIHGVQHLRCGTATTVLVLGVDLLSRFVLTGFACLQALSRTPCRPFDRDRDGLSLGEGGAWLLLATEEAARDRGWPTGVRVTGWGSACDANHITAPCREASGLKAALKQATGDGSRSVGCVNAHGTGTRYNDAMELRAFTDLWGEERPPIYSVKGAIGHCLGGAGVIEAALTAKSLTARLIPATVGATRPEADCIRPAGSDPLPLTRPSVLSCNSGFGGINAAILLENE